MPVIIIAAGAAAGLALFGYRSGGGVGEGVKIAAMGAGLGAGAYLAWKHFR